MGVIKVVLADNCAEFVNVMEEFIGAQPDMEVAGVAYNGYDALELIENERPDVVVIDILMPVLDGLGVLEKLQLAKELQIPEILMLTSTKVNKIIERALELGATNFIFKPCDLNTITKCIRNAVKRSAAGKEFLLTM